MSADHRPGIVGVPTREWLWTRSAWALKNLELPPGSRHLWNWGRSTIAAKRNLIIRKFLDADAEWVLFVDSDQAPEPGTAMHLLEVGENIVSGLIFQRVPPHAPCSGQMDDDGQARPLEAISPATKPVVEVDWTGCGCLLVRRSVFEALEPPWFEHTEPGAGEDIYFCKKAREAGFTIYVDTRRDVPHMGATPVDLDFVRTWYQTRAAEVSSAGS